MKREGFLGSHRARLLPVLLALATGKASAAALGSLTSSVGLLTALAALMALKGWPIRFAGGVASGTGGLLLLFGGAALFWRVRRRFAPALGFSPAPALATVSGASVARVARPVELPAGVDKGALLVDAKRHFVEIQAAWDDGDLAQLRRLTTPDMLEELRGQLPVSCPEPNRTDVVILHAELLDFEQLGSTCLVSIEFSGMIRERSHEGAAPFRELWMLARANVDESTWRLARQQALL